MPKANQVEVSVNSKLSPKVVAACVLAFLLPGAGHVYLRKYWHAAVFFTTTILLAVAGIMQNGELHSFLRGSANEGFLQLMASIGNIGLGILHLVFVLFGLGLGDVQAATYEYGTTFIVIAALINILVVLNAFDIASGAKK